MRQVIWFVTLICAWHPLSGFPAGAVATVDSIATDAAIATMKQGGNAIDAAVAAGLTLGVVNGYNSGLGGLAGCFKRQHGAPCRHQRAIDKVSSGYVTH